MKKIICLAVILFGGFSVFAQTERVITEDEFVNVIDNAEKQRWFFKSYPFQIMRIYEITFDHKGKIKPIQLIKSVFEDDKKGDSHYIFELSGYSLISGKPENSKVESISIRGKIFERKDNGTWSQVPKRTQNVIFSGLESPKVYFNVVNPPNILEKSVEYKYLGKELINNQMADVYTSFNNYKTAEASGTIISNKITRSYLKNHIRVV